MKAPRLFIGFVMLLLLSTLSRAAAPSTATTARPPTPAVIIALHGEVDDFRWESLVRSFAKAKQMGARTVILDMDTPGGLVTSGLEISRFLRGQNDLHVIAFVSNKAYSAGAMIAVACDEITMAPSAVIGDCAPIIFDTSGHLDPLPVAERAKQETPVVVDFDASAERNGYDRLLLESMVVVERTVHYMQSPTGERRFVDDAENAKLVAKGWTTVEGMPEPLDGPTTLFTVSTNLAKKIGLCKQVVDSPQALAESRNLAVLADLTPGGGEKFVEVLASPWLRSMFITIFFACLYISLQAPGHGAAEATGMLTLGLLVGIPLLTGYAQWWELVAIFLGLALVAFEIFVFPGHGVSLFTGAILILAGLLMTFVGREPTGTPGWLPQMGQTWAGVRQGLIVVTAGLACSMLLSMWLRKFLPHIPYFNKLILTTTSGGNRRGL